MNFCPLCNQPLVKKKGSFSKCTNRKCSLNEVEDANPQVRAIREKTKVSE